MTHRSDPYDPLLSAAITHALSTLDDEGGVHAEMWEIRRRHDNGEATRRDRHRYRTCWRALALRRSLHRRTVLPTTLDDALDRRAALLEEIHGERLRRAVDAVFAPAAEPSA